MQINLQQLQKHLSGKLSPIYLLTGDVPLLQMEARDAICQAVSQAGYRERERLDVESGFDWSQLLYLANSYNLFSEKILLELRNPNSKFDSDGSKILQSYCKKLPSDKILLIITGKLTAAQQKTTWYKSISECGVIVPIWPIKASALPSWIQTRLQQAKLRADEAAVRLLAESTEGNLLATAQAITKLQLLYPHQVIGVKEMSETISDSAQFNVFELSHYLLCGDVRGVLRVLHHLQAADVEPTLVLWLLAKECRELFAMIERLNQGEALSAVTANQWSTLQPLYQAALKRMSGAKLKRLISGCHEVDRIIKGVIPGEIWPMLTRLSLSLAGTIPLTEKNS